MAIVTISRGSFSRGKEVAERLAERLQYKCVSRDILLEACEEFSIPELRLEKALHDAPSILDRFKNGKARYLAYFKAVFLNHMKQDNVVYHGLAGHFFLDDIAHTFKVRINANMESRISAEMTSGAVSEAEARFRLNKDDAERRKWSLALYGRDTWDSSLYDMVLNIDTMTIDDVVDILAGVIEKGRFDTTQESLSRLQERSTLAGIQAELVRTAPKIDASLSDGILTLANLDGYLTSDSERRRETSLKIKEDYGVRDVVFSGPSYEKKGHVNTFYNLDI